MRDPTAWPTPRSCMLEASADLTKTKGRDGPLFWAQAGLLSEPGLQGVRTIFGFPFFQHLMIATLSLYYFACVRVFVDLNLPRLTRDRLGLCT